MRYGIRHRRARRHSKSLVVRGGLARTFGGLASFLAVIFLCGGFYILQDTLANPVAAEAVAVIAGAFSIALAAILLFYVLKPTTRPHRLPREGGVKKTNSQAEPLYFREIESMAAEDEAREDLAYQRIYVDHSRIPPRVHI